jgi:hypothetical protein
MNTYRPDLFQRPARADLEKPALKLRRPPGGEIDEPVNLKHQLRTLWRDRTMIATVTIATTIVATAISFTMPREYRASILLSPVTQRADASGHFGGLSALESSIGGFASLAGIGTPGETAKNEALAVLQSEALTEKYISDNHLLPVLYPEKWDRERQTWKVSDPKQRPTLWKANRFFDKNVRKITTSGKTGLVTMTITWTDPLVATKWANDMVRLTNDYLRGKALAESQRNIDYLNGQAARTSVVEVRQAIFSLLRNEIDRAMLARGSDEYAFKVLDPAVEPEMAYSPVKKIWALVGFAGGFFLAVLFSYLRTAWRESP